MIQNRKKLQLNPVITNVTGQTNLICFRRNFVVAKCQYIAIRKCIDKNANIAWMDQVFIFGLTRFTWLLQITF